MSLPTISRRTFVKTMAVGSGTIAYLATALTVHGAGPEVYTLRIVHTNDHHARIEPVFSGANPVHGGVSRRKTLIDAIRREGGNQLLLDAGDVFQGTLYFNQYRGLADLEFYNVLKYDAMAIGNHEFNLGPAALADFARGATFPLVGANIQVDRTSPLFGLIKPWVVVWAGNQPIGIIGVTTEDTPVLSSPGPNVRFTNYIEAVRLGVESLRRDGVNKIIALTHVGIQADRELARRVDGLSVIIGGHSHTPMGPMVNPQAPDRPYPEVIASPSRKPVIVAHDWEWGRWLGDLTIGFDASGEITRVVAGRPTEVLPRIEPDGGFENRIRTFRGPLDQLRATPVGETRVALNGERADVRARETNLGNLITDSMLAKAAPVGAQLAIMNGGGIRTSIPAGRITLGQVLEVMPFGNTLVALTLTGAQVKEALENGVSRVDRADGRFPHVGGMRYSWNSSAPAGSRITDIQVSDGRGGFVALDPNATYRVAVNNFIANGGDGYSVLQQGTNRVDTGFIDADVLVEYIQSRSPVSPQVEGRIVQDGALPGAEVAAPAPAPAETPAALPRTSGESLPAWLLALAAAGAIGGGLRLRERAARMAAASESETVETES